MHFFYIYIFKCHSYGELFNHPKYFSNTLVIYYIFIIHTNFIYNIMLFFIFYIIHYSIYILLYIHYVTDYGDGIPNVFKEVNEGNF